MSLSIDESKIKSMLREAKPTFAVAPGSVAPSADLQTMPLVSVAGTGTVEMFAIFATPDFRKDLLSLRRKIEESGITLQSPEEIENELAEMRGRK